MYVGSINNNLLFIIILFGTSINNYYGHVIVPEVNLNSNITLHLFQTFQYIYLTASTINCSRTTLYIYMAISKCSSKKLIHLCSD